MSIPPSAGCFWRGCGCGCASSPPMDTLEPLQEHTRTRPPPATAAALSCSGMAVPRQIRALERGGGQGCPSAPGFVPQLGLISRVLPVLHWFPLHVLCGFQTPPQSSPGLSPESFCLWILAILFSPTFSSLVFHDCFCPPGSFRQRCPGPAQRADPDKPCWVLQGAWDAPAAPTHPSFHPWCVLRQLQTSLQNLPCHQGSASPPHPHLPGWQSHAPLPFPPDSNHSPLLAGYLQQSHHQRAGIFPADVEQVLAHAQGRWHSLHNLQGPPRSLSIPVCPNPPLFSSAEI